MLFLINVKINNKFLIDLIDSTEILVFNGNNTLKIVLHILFKQRLTE